MASNRTRTRSRAGSNGLSLNEAAARAGVAPATLRRWAREGLIPHYAGSWSHRAVGHARIVARLRERGHSLADIRQATEIVEPSTGAPASFITFLATIGGTKWKIEYECAVSQPGSTYTECVRFAAEEGQSFPAKGARIAVDITNGSSVFTYSPTTRKEARLVTAKIELPAKGTLKQAGSTGYSHKVVLEDAAFMRNLYPEG